MGEQTMYDTIFARSFSRYEQKKFGYGALLGCLFIVLTFFIVCKPNLGPLPVPILGLRMSLSDAGLKMLSITDYSNGSLEMLKVNETITSDHLRRINGTSGSDQMLMVNDTRNSKVNDTASSKIQINNTSSSRMPLMVNDSNKSEMPVFNSTSSSQLVRGPDIESKKLQQIVCKLKQERTDYCEISGDIRIDGRSSTVFVASSQAAGTLAENSSSWIIRPYARKEDKTALSFVREWTVKSVAAGSNAIIPECTKYHSLPGVLFSSGGYAGNNFHDFTDIVIPLYITSRKFDGEVEFLITNRQSFWIGKFQRILSKLSRHEFIDIDKEEGIHCFTSVTIGLKRHPKELVIDPSKSSYSMKDFRQFLRSSYSLKKATAIKMRDGGKRRPRLLIISRKATRAFTNSNDIARMARRLGFKVVVAEADMNVTRIAEIVNSCDVLMGVHGAGLANMVFLPENAVLIQVVPLGRMDWLARTDFGEPSKDMNIRYLEYHIKTEESTLIQQYPPEHEVLSNPSAISKQGWDAYRSVYLIKQNVNLDVNRFKPTLLKALELLHQ